MSANSVLLIFWSRETRRSFLILPFLTNFSKNYFYFYFITGKRNENLNYISRYEFEKQAIIDKKEKKES